MQEQGNWKPHKLYEALKYLNEIEVEERDVINLDYIADIRACIMDTIDELEKKGNQ